jgi:hypothetical protein
MKNRLCGNAANRKKTCVDVQTCGVHDGTGGPNPLLFFVTPCHPFLPPHMGELGGETDVFFACCYCQKNTDIVLFIRSNDSLLQTIVGSLLPVI